MRRGFWFVAGAGAGVYATVRARRLAEAVTPDGLRDRLAGLALGAQLFGAEVRSGMTEKETALREQLGLAPDGPPELAASGRPQALAGARAGDPRTDATERD